MQFTLTYRGPLPGTGSAQQKHEIRTALHPQLKELWTHQPLAQHAKWLAAPSAGDPDSGSCIRHTGNHGFAVIVVERFHLVAELDVLLLRAEAPGRILQRADIDNRLKTLFDALRYPEQRQEVPSTWSPSVDQQPLFCLLEDDRLVTRVKVDTDRLLDPSSVDEAHVTIRVRIRAWAPTFASLSLGG